MSAATWIAAAVVAWVVLVFAIVRFLAIAGDRTSPYLYDGSTMRADLAAQRARRHDPFTSQLKET